MKKICVFILLIFNLTIYANGESENNYPRITEDKFLKVMKNIHVNMSSIKIKELLGSPTAGGIDMMLIGGQYHKNYYWAVYSELGGTPVMAKIGIRFEKKKTSDHSGLPLKHKGWLVGNFKITISPSPSAKSQKREPGSPIKVPVK